MFSGINRRRRSEPAPAPRITRVLPLPASARLHRLCDPRSRRLFSWAPVVRHGAALGRGGDQDGDPREESRRNQSGEVFMANRPLRGHGQPSACAMRSSTPRPRPRQTCPPPRSKSACLGPRAVIFAPKTRVAAGDSDLVVAGGLESMSRAVLYPLLYPRAQRLTAWANATIIDGIESRRLVGPSTRRPTLRAATKRRAEYKSRARRRRVRRRRAFRRATIAAQ